MVNFEVDETGLVYKLFTPYGLFVLDFATNTVLKAKHQWISKEDYLALIQDETVAKLFQAFERHIVNQSDWDAVWVWHNFRSLWEGAQDVLDQREIFDQCWNMQLNMLSTFGK